MSYASILVHVQTDTKARPRLRCARALADQFGAALIGVGVEMVPPLADGATAGAVAADWYCAVSNAIEENLKAAEAIFGDAAAGLAKDAIWQRGLSFPVLALAAASRSADLIVSNCGPRGHKSDYRDAGAAELAMTSGRPVLVVPPEAPSLTAKRIVLAWKDTREARRAMADAMPFLERAESVLVLEVCHKDDQAGAKSRTKDVAQALGRHGVAAETMVAPRAYADAPDICRQASAFGADLIVAGAYGHSRLGEWLFGGVTEELLEQKKHHLLLSH